MKVQNSHTGEVREVVKIDDEVRQLPGFKHTLRVWVFDTGMRLFLSDMLD